MSHFHMLANVATVLMSLITFYALIVKRKELFRGGIYNRQIDELLLIRRSIHDMWYALPDVHLWAKTLVENGGSIVEFKTNQQENWVTYQNFRNTCLYLFYSFSLPDNGTLPSWFKPRDHGDLLDALFAIQPFTITALTRKSRNEIVDLQNGLLKKISQIDAALNKR